MTFKMKKLLIIAALLFSYIGYAQEYISKDKIVNGIRTIEAKPAIFTYQTESYLLAWNYTHAESKNVEGYYLAILANDQIAPWNVSAGDKIYLGLLSEEEYIELSALMDAEPQAYQTDNGTFYRTLAYYIIPSTAYEKLFKGFDRLKIDIKVKNKVPVTLAIKIPFPQIEHMLMSYLDIMATTGR